MFFCDQATFTSFEDAGWNGDDNREYDEETIAAAQRMRTVLWSMPALMTAKQLADLTGEHIGSIRRGISEGRIPADKLNGRWYIPTPFLLENTFAFLSDLKAGKKPGRGDDGKAGEGAGRGGRKGAGQLGGASAKGGE